MADIGNIALFLAMIGAIYSAVAFAIGKRRNHPAMLRSARNGVVVVCAMVSAAVVVLLFALITHNFKIEYVASYTSRDLPLSYVMSALWAGNAGSLLFWAWILTIMSVVVVLQKREVGKDLVPYAATILMAIEIFFLFVILVVPHSSPFAKLSFLPSDGQGLNPLLQNAGMLVHPPFLLAGYVGFSIPFAFAISALITRKLGDEWIISIRRFTLITWVFLTLGNLFGMWWAYVELGWGGYFAWDPVENASFLPWLTGTAFLHSIMMQRRRGMLKVWNVALIVITFGLSIFGTFLTRSGIINSVHTFGESTLGPFFLTLIGIVLFGSVGLLYYRFDDLRSEAEMESLVSRESTFLLNNLLLVGSAFAIFLGTIFPIISEAVRGTKITVGPPFFNQVNGPIFMAVILLAGVCTLIGWRRTSPQNLLRTFIWPSVVAAVITLGLVVLGIRSFALIPIFLCFFVISTIAYEWIRGVRARKRMKSDSYLTGFFNLLLANRPRYGGYIVHFGLILLAVGIIGSHAFAAQTEATLKPGESMKVKNYELTYENMDTYETQKRQVMTATLAISNGGHDLGILTPQKLYDQNFQQPQTEVAIRSTLKDDLYVILVGQDDNGISFKALVNPLVLWMWIGGGIMVLGAIIAFWPDRRKLIPVSRPIKTTEAADAREEN